MFTLISITMTSFLLMECVAWLTHKYVMHGLLWILHKDHHSKENTHSFFEKNDSFFLVFAIPSIFLYAIWSFNDVWWAFPIALGITLYGITYFLVHDIFIHQRFKLFRNSESPYLKALRKAHKMHHKHLSKEDGECFGMLWFPLKYLKEYIR